MLTSPREGDDDLLWPGQLLERLVRLDNLLAVDNPHLLARRNLSL